MEQDFFSHNRQRTTLQLNGDLLVLGAYDKMQQTNDSAAPFVQESNFWWLTGIELPGWKMLLDGQTGETILVAPSLSEVEMTFETYLSASEAAAISGVSEIIEAHDFWPRVKDRSVYTLTPQDQLGEPYVLNPAPKQLHDTVQKIAREVKDARLLLARLRAIKQPAEITAITEAIQLTASAFSKICNNMQQFNNEAQIAAEFTYEFMKQGASHAYEPIVASGKNACTLHYTSNSAPLANELILIDIGAKKAGYNADITRTYARANVSKRQVAVHAAVQRAEAQIISLLKPGLPIKEYLAHVDDIVKTALLEVGLMAGRNDIKSYRRYFPHAVSHGLGVDVHDSLGRAEFFEPGMVVTVEPGIYIPEESIGVRIEDNILITEDGHENLSAMLPVVV